MHHIFLFRSSILPVILCFRFFSGQYPEPPDGETTLWGTAPYGRDILPHMKARFTGTCRFRGGFSGDNRFTRPIIEDFLRGKHQAFPEDKSGPEKPPRNLLSTCSGRESSGRLSRPYGAVPQSVVSPSGGSYLPPADERKHIVCSSVVF